MMINYGCYLATRSDLPLAQSRFGILGMALIGILLMLRQNIMPEILAQLLFIKIVSGFHQAILMQVKKMQSGPVNMIL